MRIINGSSAANTIRGTSVAEKILGNNGNDSLYGGGGNDILDGGFGNDRLYGESGNDRLIGGAGDDRLYGGIGNDVLTDIAGTDYFNGGDGFDTLDYSSTLGRGVDVFLNLGIGGRAAAGDTYTQIENIVGSNYQDFLWGNAANNVINGGNGNDYLRGFDGNDLLIGGEGNDELYGDAGNDVFRPGMGQDIIIGGAGTDRVDLSLEKAGVVIDFAGNAFTGPLEAWGLPGGDQIYAEVLTGTKFNDKIDLTGQVIWEFTTLDGGAGNDELKGVQKFIGGAGEDTIRLTDGAVESVVLQNDLGIDKIARFNAAEGDKLLISKAQFGLTTDTNGDPVYAWVDTTDEPTALAAGPAFIYEQSTQILWFDADGTGAAKAPVALAGFYGLPVDQISGLTVHPVAADLIFTA